MPSLFPKAVKVKKVVFQLIQESFSEKTTSERLIPKQVFNDVDKIIAFSQSISLHKTCVCVCVCVF